MDILAAIKREERKLEKQLGKLQHQLNRVRAAAKALGDSTNKEIKVVKKRVLSAAGALAVCLHLPLCNRRRLLAQSQHWKYQESDMQWD